jgi:UDPglucose--hexose-1-phosphate uridylyltransferase
MSQLRKDVFSGRWVIIEQTDVLRPSDFRFTRFTRETTLCPFCEEHEASTPPEIYALRPNGSAPNATGWKVRVVPNSRLRLSIEGDLDRRPEGFHDLMNGIGADEIVAETPRHDRSLHDLEAHEIADVLRTFIVRILDLEKDKRLRYVLVFKNHGVEAGARTITHSISQLMALPVNPRVIKSKLAAAYEYYELKDRCIYCDVLQQELHDRKRLITENDDFAAIAPFASRSPFEVCILPKFHSSAFCQMTPPQTENAAAILRDVLQRLDRTLGGPPYNLALQNRPFLRPREGYWKTIEEDFHWHIEILPQVIGMTGFERASWFFYNPVPPELAVKCLKG